VPLVFNRKFVAREIKANSYLPIEGGGNVCFYTNGHAAILAHIAG
jgi:hypothetical protein